MICITGSSWISRNPWPAWNQGSQSECFFSNWIYLKMCHDIRGSAFSCYDLTLHHCSALSLKGYSGLDGTKGETGAVGSKVHFYCFYPPVHLVLIVVKTQKKHEFKTYSTLFLYRVRLVPREKTAPPAQWWVELHLTSSTLKTSFVVRAPTPKSGNDSNMSSSASLMQGPRGLPGERGRPGPSGVAVSVFFYLFFFLIFSSLHSFTSQTDATLNSKGWNWLTILCVMHLYMFNSVLTYLGCTW